MHNIKFRVSIACILYLFSIVYVVNKPLKPEVNRVEIYLSGNYKGDTWQLYYDNGRGRCRLY